jgi:hypothetical protein
MSPKARKIMAGIIAVLLVVCMVIPMALSYLRI